MKPMLPTKNLFVLYNKKRSGIITAHVLATHLSKPSHSRCTWSCHVLSAYLSCTDPDLAILLILP